ncbi:MAG: adenine phosphoribosyltransferase [Acidobacteriota bacterium]|nr:adenine phosphoribosyltransferase [Acidobacteriota bacterium]
MLTADLKKTIREVPDFPKPGINFYDLTTLFLNPEAFRSAVDRMVERYRGEKLTAIVGIESRGFVLGSVMALELGVGMVLARKPGKLPADTEKEDYELEYGQATLEIHRDAVGPEDRVLVVDDLLATGGTAAASGRLVERLGARVEGYAFLVELSFLKGREQLGSANVFSLLQYD